MRSFNWSSRLRTKGRVVVVVPKAWRDAEHELGERSNLKVGDCWVVELSLYSSTACQDRYSKERSFARPVRIKVLGIYFFEVCFQTVR